MTGEKTWGDKIPGGWFDETRHLYRCDDGVPVVSSTQVFDILGCTDFNRAKPEVLEFKRLYGTAMHKCTEYLVQGDLNWDSVDDRLIQPLTGIEKFIQENQFQSDGVEERMVHSIYGMKYGMTLDHRGTMMYRGVRRHVIWDLKTGVKFSPTWVWQLGGYLHPQPPVVNGWLAVVVQVEPTGRVIPHYVKDVEKAKREFQILLAAANLKTNNGLAEIGKVAA